MSRASSRGPLAGGLGEGRGFSAGWQEVSHSTDVRAPLDRVLDLYPFQREVLARIEAAIAAGRRRICLVAPTGGGKSVIAAAKITEVVARRDHVVFAAHRVLVSHGKSWASLPSKPVLDREGRHREIDGKKQYTPVLEWGSREIADRFSAAVVQLVRRAHPGALGEVG